MIFEKQIFSVLVYIINCIAYIMDTDTFISVSFGSNYVSAGQGMLSFVGR